MGQDKGIPPKAHICEDCYGRQREAACANDEFYCEHEMVWAIRRPDGGWLLSTGVSPSDHQALLEDARQLQSVDESPAPDLAVPSMH